MGFPVCKLYHCPCLSDYTKNVLIKMKITISGLIIEMFNILGEGYCYELFSHENTLLVTCREHLIKTFVFDLSHCLHYYERRHFVFYNTIDYKTHRKCCKKIKCYVCYRTTLLQIKRAFPVFII